MTCNFITQYTTASYITYSTGTVTCTYTTYSYNTITATYTTTILILLFKLQNYIILLKLSGYCKLRKKKKKKKKKHIEKV